MSRKFEDQYNVSSKQSNANFWNNNDCYEIPFNQRSYQWSEINAHTLMNDIHNAMMSNSKFYTLGTFYFLKEIRKITIWDGQQRVITSYLILSSFYNITKKILLNIAKKEIICKDEKLLLKKKICEKIIGRLHNYLFKKDYDLKEDQELKDFELNIFTPKLYTVHTNDYMLLKKIFNGNMEDLKCCYELGINEKYKCFNCKKQYKLEKHIEKHLFECKGKSDDTFVSKIDNYNNNTNGFDKINLMKHPMLKAQNAINKFIKDKIGIGIDSIEKIEKFLFFFENNVPHEEYICTNINCATIIFDLLNNRGMKLEQSDIIRNSLIRLLPEDKRENYFVKFKDIIDIPCSMVNLFKNNSNYLKLLCIMTNKKIQTIDCIADSYKEILENNENNGNIEKNFLKIEFNVKLLTEIYEHIKKNKWGNIYFLDHISEIFQYIIIPFYMMFKNDNKFKNLFEIFLEIIVCYQIKSCTRARNYVGVKEEFYDFGNKIFNGEYDINNVNELLINFIKNIILKNIDCNFDDLKNKKMQISNTKIILLYLELKNRPNGIEFDLNNIDIEHIMPKNSKEKKEIDKLGNLTLLEKGNSDNGHKGNRSLQDKKFKIKKNEYVKSNFEITKNIKEINKDVWSNDDILVRTDLIINEISNYVNNILNIKNDKFKTEILNNYDSESDDDYNSNGDNSDNSDDESKIISNNKINIKNISSSNKFMKKSNFIN